MSLVEQLAEFVVTASYEDLSHAARKALKIRVLDSLGCAIGEYVDALKFAGGSFTLMPDGPYSRPNVFLMPEPI
jgi:2-methylcitrate dehydratase PrpD